MPEPLDLLFPEATYRLWLARRSAVYTNQYFNLLSFVILFATIRQVMEGNSAQEYASLFFLACYLVRFVGTRSHQAWLEQHTKMQHVIWHIIRIATQLVAILFGWHFGGAPPLPYLMQFDWLVEGVLPTLCAPVRTGGLQGIHSGCLVEAKCQICVAWGVRRNICRFVP